METFPNELGLGNIRGKSYVRFLCNLISSYPEVESNNPFVILTTLTHRDNFSVPLDLLLQQLSCETNSK